MGEPQSKLEAQPESSQETVGSGIRPRVDRRRDCCHYCGAEVPKELSTCPKCGRRAFQQRFLGEILIDEGLVSREKLREALHLQKRKLGEILIDIGACRPEDLERALTMQRVGRTRSDIYARYLKVAVALLVIAIGFLINSEVRLERSTQFMTRMHKKELTVAEVGELLKGTSSYSKIEALRSLTNHLNDPSIVPVLASALRHDQWDVKLYGIVLARKVGNPELIPDLLEIMKQDPEFVAPVAQDAIQAITVNRVGSGAPPR